VHPNLRRKNKSDRKQAVIQNEEKKVSQHEITLLNSYLIKKAAGKVDFPPLKRSHMPAVTYFKFSILLLLLPVLVSGQAKTFELFGTITGEYKDRIYLFYDGNVAQKDSLSAGIKNGNFYFKLKANLPILCRLHFGENTNIRELYIDGEKTFISLFSQLSEKENPDSLGGARTNFTIRNVKGSRTEAIKLSFEAWKEELEKTGLSKEEKHSEYFTKLQSLVATHRNSKASAYLIAGGMYIMGEAFMLMGKHHFTYSEVNQLAGLLDTSLHHTLEWQNLLKVLNRLDSERHRTNGNEFHDVALKDTGGRVVDTRSFRNKYVLVDFWASWCKPCRALNPELKVLYEKYHEKGFEIIGVSLDTEKNAWRKAIIQDRLPWVQLIDENAFNGELAKYYDIYGVPVKILLDKEGKISGFDLSTSEIDRILSKAL
jgi:thiol-disulfide isomerase/thioredoxin